MADSLKDRIFSQAKRCTDAEVALHELYGHGSCRLIYKKDFEGLSSEEKALLHSSYEEGQTFYGTFTSLQSAFEECRAEVTAHYLIEKEIAHKIFKVENAKDFMLSSAYSMALAGILGLMQFDAASSKWLQAHSQANHLILKNALKSKALEVLITKDGTDLEIRIDESRIGEIAEAHGQLVRQLNLLKAGADFEGAQRLFAELTTLDPFWLEVRRIAIANKKPRFAMLPGVLVRDGAKWRIDDAAPEEGLEALGVAQVYTGNLVAAGI